MTYFLTYLYLFGNKCASYRFSRDLAVGKNLCLIAESNWCSSVNSQWIDLKFELYIYICNILVLDM